MTTDSIRAGRQRGFTLIELISVIIILGILAAVLTPKYFDMATKADEAVQKGVKSEAVARFNMAYAKYVIDKGVSPGATASAGLTNLSTSDYLGASPINAGDYNLSYAASADDTVTVTVSKRNVTTQPTGWPVTQDIPYPQ